MHKKFILPAAAALLCVFQGSAQTQDSLVTNKPDQVLQPAEVRSLRVSSNAPFVKTDMNAKDIEKLNLGQDLPFLLQYTPSAVTTSDAGAGVGYTGVRVRGTDGSRINVTLNGVPVNDAESAGAYFVDLPDVSSSTNSIQVQRGVGTSTNGVGSFGAAISINNLAQMQEAGAEGSFSFGSFNTQRYTVKAGTGMLAHGFQLDVRMSKISSDGYIDRAASDLRSIQLIGGWKASEKTSFHVMVMSGTEKTYQAWNGVPEEKLYGNDSALMTHYQNNIGSAYFTPADSLNLFTSNKRRFNQFTYGNQTDNYQQDYYQFFADHQFSKNITGHIGLFYTRGKGYYEEYKNAQAYSSYGLPNVVTPAGDTFTTTDLIRQLWLDNKYYGTVFSLTYDKNKTNITLGGALERYEGYHYGFVKWAEMGGIPADYRWYLLNANKDEGNVYVKAQHTLGTSLILFGDLQYRHVSHTINGFQENPTLNVAVNYDFFNPKAGVTYLLKNTRAEKQKLYLSFAVANKEPNREDFESSTKTLAKPEQLYDVEGGYEINKKTWTAAANLFYMGYHNQLILTGKVNDVGAYTRTNVAASYREGIELQAAWQAMHWLKIGGNLTLSANKVKDFIEYVDDYDNGNQTAINHGNTDIAFSPSTVAAGIITIEPFRYLNEGQHFGIDLCTKYVGKQYLDNTSNDKRSIKAYNICDVRVRYGFKVKPFREASVSLAVNNIFNKMYESNGYTYSYIYGGAFTTQNYYFPQAGTYFLVGLNVKW